MFTAVGYCRFCAAVKFRSTMIAVVWHWCFFAVETHADSVLPAMTSNALKGRPSLRFLALMAAEASPSPLGLRQL